MPDFDLSITICSWNTLSDLRACLASLRAAQNEGHFEVVVVENNSADGSGEMVESEYPEVRLLKQSRNLGFTGGHNVAIAERHGRDVALLNSDTVVHAGAIGRIMQFMRDHPEAGIVGPKLLNTDGSLQYSCRTWPQPIGAAFRNTPLEKLFPKNRFTSDYLMRDFDHASVRKVDWVSGAAMFIRKDVVDAIGGLDPVYFMYCEDTDYCWRAARAGFDTYYLPDAVITHHVGRSTDKAVNRNLFRHHRAMYIFYRKTLVDTSPVVRPLLLGFAAFALTVRLALYVVKNKVEALMRQWRSR